MTDPVLFLATVSLAAVHLDILYGRYQSTQILIQKGQTIGVINERIRSGTGAVSDATIAAIAMVAVMEVRLHHYSFP